MPETPKIENPEQPKPDKKQEAEAAKPDRKADSQDYFTKFKEKYFEKDSMDAFSKSEADGFKKMTSTYLGMNLEKVKFEKVLVPNEKGGQGVQRYFTLRDQKGRLIGALYFDQRDKANETLTYLDASGKGMFKDDFKAMVEARIQRAEKEQSSDADDSAKLQGLEKTLSDIKEENTQSVKGLKPLPERKR